MSDELQRPAYVRPLVWSVGAVLAAILAIAAARETGLVTPDLGKRLGAAMIGLMLAVCGNILPKIARRLEMGRETAAAFAAADRNAGWILVLFGVLYAAVWLSAPLDRAALGASCVGLGGLLLALGFWLWRVRPTEPYASPGLLTSTAMAGRLTVFFLIGGVFGAGLLIQIDAAFGDQIAQWTAVGFAVGMPMGVAAVYLLARRRAGADA